MTELYRLNNNIKAKGIFTKADHLYPRFLFTIDDPDKRSLIYMPVINWTRPDGFMAGLALYNGLFIPKPVEYLFIPFYAFQNSGLRGFGRISLNKIPYDSFIRLLKLSLEGEKFGAPGNQDYFKTKIGLDVFFRQNSAVNPISHKIYGHYIAASDLRQFESQSPSGMLSFLSLGYQLARNGIINPYNMVVSVESGESFIKTAAELNFRYSYYGRNRGFDARLFTGTMLKTGSSDPFYSLSSSGRGGPELYLYQGFYPDRFTGFPETFWSKQMTLNEGGLVTPVSDSLGYSRWLSSLTLTSSPPCENYMDPGKAICYGLGEWY